MLNRISIVCVASLMSVGGTAAMAAPSFTLSSAPASDTLITHVRAGGGGGGGGHMGGGGGGSHMGGGGGPHMGSGGGPHVSGGQRSGDGSRMAAGTHHRGPMHDGGHHHGRRVGGLFIWGYDPGWSDCYYSYRYNGWVCPDW